MNLKKLHTRWTRKGPKRSTSHEHSAAEFGHTMGGHTIHRTHCRESINPQEDSVEGRRPRELDRQSKKETLMKAGVPVLSHGKQLAA
mmetsp:Transcript_804/g.1754  ORF Transcript_804/g.1754 Transcript_804/m.1754 type:complete len:87 (-) Transcript_804:15-275(-)